jgi:hypothetical protein
VKRSIFVPHRLYSLLDMKKFLADRFFVDAATFAKIVAGFEGEPDGAIVADEPLGLLHKLMSTTAAWYAVAELPVSASNAGRIANKLIKDEKYPIRWKEVRRLAAGLNERIEEELEMKLFLNISQSEITRYRERHPFGAALAKWPELQEDIQEANKSLVVHRYTASVFHVMRVMERLVQMIADDYGIQPTDNRVVVPIESVSWDKLLTEISNRLGKHTKAGETAKDSRMREIAVSLDSIRGIWRNPTAHPRHHYTKAQAHSIFNLSKEVTQQIAALI